MFKQKVKKFENDPSLCPNHDFLEKYAKVQFTTLQELFFEIPESCKN